MKKDFRKFVPGVKIQKRWQSLRTSFKKEYNAQRDTKSGQAGKKRKKYEFYGQLLFLLPTLTERTTPTEILSTDKQQPKISAAASTSTDDSLPKAASPPTINNTPQTSAQSSIPKNKDKSISSKIYEERLLGILEEKRSEPIDEDKSFLISLVPSFKRMTNQQKLKAKMQFLQILSDIQEESDYNVIYPTASQNIEYSNEEFDMPSPESSKVTIKEEILDLGS